MREREQRKMQIDLKGFIPFYCYGQKIIDNRLGDPIFMNH